MENYIFSPKNRDKNAIPNVLHWSDSGIATWYDVAVLIEETSRKLRLIEKTNYIRPIQSSMFKSKAERPAYSVLDSSETHSLLDVPYVHWKENLNEIIKKIYKKRNLLFN